MSSSHASNIGMVAEEGHVRQDPEHEGDLITRYGYLAVECLLFRDDMHDITTYSDAGDYGIIGVHIHSATNDQLVGHEHAMAKHFPIHGPAEVVIEIDVGTSSISTAFRMRTSKFELCSHTSHSSS